MKYMNTATYTVNGREYDAQFASARPVHARYAQRILRRTKPGAIVTRVESASLR